MSPFQAKVKVAVWLPNSESRMSGVHHPLLLYITLPVADPGFPRGGGVNPRGWGANLLFGQKFPENCMKMKEFGPRGAHPWRPLLDSPMLAAQNPFCIKVVLDIGRSGSNCRAWNIYPIYPTPFTDIKYI